MHALECFSAGSILGGPLNSLFGGYVGVEMGARTGAGEPVSFASSAAFGISGECPARILSIVCSISDNFSARYNSKRQKLLFCWFFLD